MPRTPKEELVHFLSDLYSVELQALAQLVKAPDLAGDAGLAEDFRLHEAETERQVELVRERLEALGGSPSTVKDAIMKLGGKGFLLFAGMQKETPGRLLAHAYSYEAMEWAGYAVLISLAELDGDTTTAAVASEIQTEERTMMNRLECRFDAIEALAHAETPASELRDHVEKHLAEVHAIESQSIALLDKGTEICREPALARCFASHLGETRAQHALVERRLETLGGSASTLQDAALALGGLNWGNFFRAQSDTPAKLVAFAYAVEHLEIAAYELLLRTARRIVDTETEDLCRRILEEERAMAERLAGSIDLAVRSTVGAVRT